MSNSQKQNPLAFALLGTAVSARLRHHGRTQIPTAAHVFLAGGAHQLLTVSTLSVLSPLWGLRPLGSPVDELPRLLVQNVFDGRRLAPVIL